MSINSNKSGIRRPVHFTILEFGFVPTYRKGERGKYQLVVSDKGWKSLRQKLKTITRKTTPVSFDERIGKLGEVQRGWINVFRMASIQNKLAELDGWLRNRLRYCIWSGNCRRKSLNGKGKTLSVLELNQHKLINGVARVWEDGVLLKVQLLVLQSLLND